MESVGSQLRQARQRLGLSLEQASAKTRISTKNLQAIEDDNLTHISSPFFYRSFVKQFAEYLNLDYNRMAGAVQEMTSGMPEPLMPGEVPHADAGRPKIAPLEVRRRPWNLRWLSSLTSFVLMLAACSSFYAVWQNSRSNWRASLSAFVTFLMPTSHGARMAATQQSLMPLSPIPEAGFHVELSALERTWITIVEDGQETFHGTLEAAETKVLEGHETARIRTGNAGAIKLVFNGKPIGTLRPDGQARTVVFTKDNYELLETSPAVTPAHFSPSAE